jgi:diguanylate cyclase (GGDEF)-like protein
MVLTYIDVTENKEAALILEQTKRTAEDAMVELSRAHEKVKHIAYHDQLTGLPNRRLFTDRAEQAIAVAARQKSKLAVCYLDLDGFKQVNDMHGHGAGDALLIATGERLTSCVRAHDTVCRLGGDEFVLLLTSFEHEDEVLSVLQRVLVEIAKPLAITAMATVEVSVSIGYAIFPDDATEKGILLRRADHAMYEGKKQGKNCIVRFLADSQLKTKASA